MTREEVRSPRGSPPEALDLARYRRAVAALLEEVDLCVGLGRPEEVPGIVVDRIAQPELVAVLAATPRGLDDAAERLLEEIRGYRPNVRSSATDLTALVRIFLLSRIDLVWWSHLAEYDRDADALAAGELVDLEPLRRRGLLEFRYRRQARTIGARVRNAVVRRVAPDRSPATAGLLFSRARPEVIALLNECAREFTRRAPAGTPPMWVTSLARSLEHQHRLRGLGYAALLPSAHCVGYAADVEMAWYERFGAADALAEVLFARQEAGDVNVVDEGRAWHLCVAPGACDALMRSYVDSTSG